MNDPSIHRTRRSAGAALIFLGGIVLCVSGILKLAHIPGAVIQMRAWGFDEAGLVAIAILELLCVLALLVPATRSIGLLLVSAYLGGAIATHMEHAEAVKGAGPAVILLVICLGSWLRHPAVLWSLNRISRDEPASGLEHRSNVEAA